MAEVLDKQTIKALGAEARQDIMKMLARRPYTASELAKITHRHVTTVTEHLEVLERSGLVKKKESTNKWVYYALSDKGEHLFKPQFYSWVVVFCVSVVLMFVGFLRVFEFTAQTQSALDATQKAGEAAPLAVTTTQIAPVDYIGYGLIILGIVGLAYLAYKKYSKK